MRSDRSAELRIVRAAFEHDRGSAHAHNAKPCLRIVRRLALPRDSARLKGWKAGKPADRREAAGATKRSLCVQSAIVSVPAQTRPLRRALGERRQSLRRADFQTNMAAKKQAGTFAQVVPLLVPGAAFDVGAALTWFEQMVMPRFPV